MVDILDNEPEGKNPRETREKRRAAVAIGRDEKGGTIPKLLAAGHGALAEEILRLAFDNGVKVREDADLAEMLAAIELESEIPSEALIAIAEILSYVYKANGDYQPDKGHAKNADGTDSSPP